MRQFIERHEKKIQGVLNGFDRLLFRGHLTNLCHSDGVKRFLASQKVLLKDFGAFVEKMTSLVRYAATETARQFSFPVQYLDSSRTRKEDVAKKILAERGVERGPICTLTALEPCSTWQIFRSKEAQTQEPKRRSGKCLHLYTYFVHPEFGFMHVRVQTWMPYTVQVYVNGREWLAQQLASAGITASRADNCFTWLSDPKAAQKIMDKMLDLPWIRLLDEVTFEANPFLEHLQQASGGSFHWTIHQSEWATDIMFKRPTDLAAIYPSFTRHAISEFSSPHVMRFLGKRLVPQFQGEIVSNYKVRPEGICVKHAAAQNSIKMYDKAGSTLRIETTIQRPAEFKRKRRAEGKPDSPVELRPIRKGVADIKARASVSQEANSRYLDALAVVDEDNVVQEILKDVLVPAEIGDRRVRALRPWSEPDLNLLRAVARGEFVTAGFRNRDIAALLCPEHENDASRKCSSARISRLLRLLRAHGIIRKREGTHRHFVTNKGRVVIAAVIATSTAQLSKLKQCA